MMSSDLPKLLNTEKCCKKWKIWRLDDESYKSLPPKLKDIEKYCSKNCHEPRKGVFLPFTCE